MTKLMADLYTIFCQIYGDKFVKSYHNESFIKGWIYEWSEGLKGTEEKYIKQAIAYCRSHKEWPPSIAEFLNVCEKSEGIPTWQDALQDAIRKDFHHPIIQLAYQKVGSWNMKHCNLETVNEMFKNAYNDALATFRTNRINGVKEIEDLKKPDNLIELSGTG